MSGSAYYNEHDPFAAAWLRELIAAGHIAPGVVDERDIRDIRPDELAGFAQCHFFAGIGGWSLALRLAGIPDDYPVWTGSCPCQPFSAAGGRAGFADERHLWPAFFHLIEQFEPVRVLGEQVAGGNVDPWFDLIQADLEGVGYAFGLCPAPAAGFGAPHIRDRAYWLADALHDGRGQHGRRMDRASSADEGAAGERQRLRAYPADDGAAGGLDQSPSVGRTRGRPGTEHGLALQASAADGRLVHLGRPGSVNGFWQDADWLLCRDERWRPVEPGTQPLADGVPARVGRLRGYGNAIVAQEAAEFVAAALLTTKS